MRILTRQEVVAAEGEATSRPEVSTLVLMRRAGYAAAQFCRANFKFRSVCVVCGRGNNGGDGLVAAEALAGTAEVQVVILAGDAGQLSPDAAAMCSRLGFDPLWAPDEAALASDAVREALAADLIIDAIVGTGFKPPLKGLARKAVEAINDSFGTVVAMDLPSGVDADSTTPLHENNADVVFAHGIVTFIAPKPAHVFGELTSGPIAVSEIGVSPGVLENKTGLEVITGQEVGITFPPRRREAHKGEFGHVLVIAGSLGKAGAAGLAGMAALRTGAGLVTVACPRSIQATVAGFAPEVMTEGLPETDEGTIAISAGSKAQTLFHGKDAIVLGPGLSQNPQTAEFVRHLVASSPLPLVLDADGLNAFDGHYEQLKPRGHAAPFRVLTPHPGEAARLLGASIAQIQADRLATARRMARETGSCVVLKGSRTVVAGVSGETWINMSGNPALAKGGSGDVLSGIIGAALARQGSVPLRPPMQNNTASGARGNTNEHLTHKSAGASAFLDDVRVAAGVHLHGLAADLARDALHENTVLATDLFHAMHEAFHDFDLQAERGLFYLQK